VTQAPLPPGCVTRGQFLLSGRIKPRDAEPLTLAYATQHILTHPNLEADAFRRSREEQALAELRASLGTWPWHRFGEAALRAVVLTRGGECRRCRGDMISRVGRLAAPPSDPATSWLLGECERCAPIQPLVARPGRTVAVPPERAAVTAAAVRALLPLLPSDRVIDRLVASASVTDQRAFIRDMVTSGKHRAYTALRARVATR
jgi:hypothetical protein